VKQKLVDQIGWPRILIQIKLDLDWWNAPLLADLLRADQRLYRPAYIISGADNQAYAIIMWLMSVWVSTNVCQVATSPPTVSLWFSRILSHKTVEQIFEILLLQILSNFVKF